MNATRDTEIDAYVDSVERHLDDLPEDVRRDLLQDLRSHLREIVAESDGELADRLGPPATYAAELRMSTGLPERTVAVDSSMRGSPRPVLTRGDLLRAGWWVLRGGLSAWVALGVLNVERARSVTLPFVDGRGSSRFGLIVLFGAIAASMMLGSRASRDATARLLNRAADIGVVAVAAIWILLLPSQPDIVVRERVVPYLHHGDGSVISNICTYDSKGRAMKGVFLTDQDGRAIYDLASPGDGQVEKGKKQAWNEFPRKQVFVEPNTGKTVKFACPKYEEPRKPQQVFGP